MSNRPTEADVRGLMEHIGRIVAVMQSEVPLCYENFRYAEMLQLSALCEDWLRLNAAIRIRHNKYVECSPEQLTEAQRLLDEVAQEPPHA